MTTKLKPVDSIVAEISPQVVCDDLARNSMEWFIKTAVTSDRHTIYTALREGIKQEKFKHEEGGCYMCQCKTYDRALNQILTLLDELFGVSK